MYIFLLILNHLNVLTIQNGLIILNYFEIVTTILIMVRKKKLKQKNKR